MTASGVIQGCDGAPAWRKEMVKILFHDKLSAPQLQTLQGKRYGAIASF
jgi:hypothetical protein